MLNSAAWSQESNDRLAAKIQFVDILASPDDVLLNTRYAEQQILVGDLLGALSALERVLIAQPENSFARLTVARVRVWLGNFDQAKADLKAFDGVDLPPAATRLVESLLADIENATRGYSFGGDLTISLWRSDNPGQYPRGGVTELLGQDPLPTFLDSEGNAGPKPVTGRTVSAYIRYLHDLPLANWRRAGVSVRASKTSDIGSQLSDGRWVSIKLESQVQSGLGAWVPRLSWTTSESFYGNRQKQLEVGLGWAASDSWVPFNADFSGRHVSVDTPSGARTKDYRQAQVSVGLLHQASERTYLSVNLAYQKKRAHAPSAAAASQLINNRGVSMSIAGTLLVSGRISLRAGVEQQRTNWVDRYSLEPRRRADRSIQRSLSAQYRVKLFSTSAPLSIDLTWRGVRNRSNLSTYQYDSNLTELTLRQRY